MVSPESSPSERRYAEEEARTVFQRAAARQEAARAASETKGAHLTLHELQKIGEEVGIDPAFIAAAAAEVNQSTAEQKSFFLGRRHLQLNRVLPGVLSTSTWEAIVDELRDSFDTPGIAGQVGSTREWTPSGQSSVRVVAKPEEDMTRLTIEQSFKEDSIAAPVLGAGFALMGILIGALTLFGGEVNWGPALTFLTLAPISFFAVRYGTDVYINRQERHLERILDRLELVALKDAATPTPPALTESSSEPALGDALEGAEDEQSTRSSQRQRDRS